MGKVTPFTEQFQHFLAELKDSFWGDLYGATRVAWKKFLDRIIYSIFHRFNLEWRNRTLHAFTQAA